MTVKELKEILNKLPDNLTQEQMDNMEVRMYVEEPGLMQISPLHTGVSEFSDTQEYTEQSTHRFFLISQDGVFEGYEEDNQEENLPE